MTCRCASPQVHADRAASYLSQQHAEEIKTYKKELAALRADISNYDILDCVSVGKHLVLKVQYMHPDGIDVQADCTFQGVKVMVFTYTSVKDALLWREIDPHFREPGADKNMRAAPSPAARFPGNEKGWNDALIYANARTAEGK